MKLLKILDLVGSIALFLSSLWAWAYAIHVTPSDAWYSVVLGITLIFFIMLTFANMLMSFVRITP